MSAERDAFFMKLRACGVAAAAAQREVDRVLGKVDAHDNRREKAIEHDGDKLMLEHGFEVIRFSHPGKTKQTPGIPDRRYYRRPRSFCDTRWILPPLVVWWEAKSATGKQRPGQKLFQEMAEACGEAYVLGGLDELSRWLAANVQA